MALEPVALPLDRVDPVQIRRDQLPADELVVSPPGPNQDDPAQRAGDQARAAPVADQAQVDPRPGPAAKHVRKLPREGFDRILPGLLDRAAIAGPSVFTRFVSSGFFFMIVGTVFLTIAYKTMGQTHSAMSFVFVVVGVAILLYGTGTQGIGELNSTENAATVAKYKVALAGGAGVIAFCVAGGIIAFSGDIKSAFQIEQKYVRFYIKGKGYQPDDIGRYIPDVRINGNPVAAVRRGDYIEVFAPYVPTRQPARFEIKAKLRLVEALSGLLPTPDGEFVVQLDHQGNVTEAGSPNGTYAQDSGYDFPWYQLKQFIGLEDTSVPLASGYVPK